MKQFTRLLMKIAVFILIVLGFTYYFFPGIIIKSATVAFRLLCGLEQKEIQVHDHRWVYLQGGRGETVVLLHGLGQNKDLWEKMPADFTPEFQIIIPDLPGFGESGRIKDASYDIISQAGRFNDFINALHIGSFHLVGISMGGTIAAWYAAYHPERVKSLTLMAPFGVISPVKSHLMEMRDKHKNEKWSFSFTTPEEFDAVMSLLAERPPKIPNHLKAYIAREASRDFSLHDRIFRKDLLPHENILEPIIPLIQSPTLVIWGKDDGLFHFSSIEKFIRNKKVKPLLLEECGHIIYMDQPEKTSSAIRGFIEKNSIKN